MKNITALFFYLILSFGVINFFTANVLAEDIYKITDPITVPPPSVVGIGRVIWGKSFVYERKDSPVIWSANPDRSGSMNTGDQIQVFITYIGSLETKTFNYNSAPNCQTHTTLPPTDLSNYFPLKGGYNVSIRILDWCGRTQNISSMYWIGGIPVSGPEPFLDLPWNYSAHGLTFDDAALSMTAFFDHTYPLLSSGKQEPTEKQDQVTTFENEVTNQKPYSSHDGYDFAWLAGAGLGEPVLAAAPGIATYVGDCGACGNMILIDHGNGYQTRYLHLQKEGLITNQAGVKVPVVDGQVIGKVGASGNVMPSGLSGAHLHFMVVEDKNRDGNFDDNIPDGVIDPYGWLSTLSDPWVSYVFNQNNIIKTGNKSYYLFKKPLGSVTKNLSSQPEVFIVNNFAISFPEAATSQTLTVNIHTSPVAKISNSVISIGPSLNAVAKDVLGNAVTFFNKSFTLKVDFGTFDISLFKPETIAVYSSQDGMKWDKEITMVDFSSKTATAQVDHFSHFALFGEKKDTVAPSTKLNLIGDRGEGSWFRGDVTLEFQSQDNQEGLGVDYTLYSVNGSQWQNYSLPMIFSQPAHYKINYYSVDREENIETMKTAEFDIDKQIPEISLQYDPKSQDISFTATDDHEVSLNRGSILHNEDKVTAVDKAGNMLIMLFREKIGGKNSRLSIKSLTYGAKQFELPDNAFAVSYRLDEQNQDQRKLEQTFKLSNNLNIKLLYRLTADETSVSVNNDTPEEIGGMKLLQISTKNGNLIYTY